MKSVWMGIGIVLGTALLLQTVRAEPAPTNHRFDLQVTPQGMAYEIDRDTGEVWCIALHRKTSVGQVGWDVNGGFLEELRGLEAFVKATK